MLLFPYEMIHSFLYLAILFCIFVGLFKISEYIVVKKILNFMDVKKRKMISLLIFICCIAVIIFIINNESHIINRFISRII